METQVVPGKGKTEMTKQQRSKVLMSSCATQIFEGVTLEKWNLLVAKAKSLGVDIVDDSGSLSRDGFTGRWNYDRSANELSIQCTDKPFYVSCGLVNSKVHEYLDPLLG